MIFPSKKDLIPMKTNNEFGKSGGVGTMGEQFSLVLSAYHVQSTLPDLAVDSSMTKS